MQVSGVYTNFQDTKTVHEARRASRTLHGLPNRLLKLNVIICWLATDRQIKGQYQLATRKHEQRQRRAWFPAAQRLTSAQIKTRRSPAFSPRYQSNALGTWSKLAECRPSHHDNQNNSGCDQTQRANSLSACSLLAEVHIFSCAWRAGSRVDTPAVGFLAPDLPKRDGPDGLRIRASLPLRIRIVVEEKLLGQLTKFLFLFL